MRVPGLNTSAWLRRLGVKEREDLELIPSVQPVVVVGDHRDVLNRLRPARGHVQTFHGNVAGSGRTGTIEVACRASGGCFLQMAFSVEIASIASAYLVYQFSGAAAVGINTPTNHVVQLEDPAKPIRSTFTSGRGGALGVRIIANPDAVPILLGSLFDGVPATLHGGPAGPASPVFECFLPAGRFLFMEGYAVDVDQVASWVVTEYEAMEPSGS